MNLFAEFIRYRSDGAESIKVVEIYQVPGMHVGCQVPGVNEETKALIAALALLHSALKTLGCSTCFSPY